jgi:uncharacterized protein (TIGR03435 family)
VFSRAKAHLAEDSSQTAKYPFAASLKPGRHSPGSLCLPLAIGLLTAAAATAQIPPLPSFEVASVKPGVSPSTGIPIRSGGRIRWTAQLAFVIAYAYNIDLARLESVPNIARIYVIEATFDPAASEDQLRLMLRSLLIERFKLKARVVPVDVDGYAMTVAKSGLKIKEFKDGDEPPPKADWSTDNSPEGRAYSGIGVTVLEGGVGGLSARRVSMSQLAQTVERSIKAPVWDRTGLTGKYYFWFRFDLNRNPAPESAVPYPLIDTALRDYLGLDLKKQKGQIEKLIVDSVEPPSEN